MLRNMPLEIDLTDPHVLRALAHPTRLRILEVVRAQGPVTATRVAAELAESVASASYHLRLLAKYGFVERARDASGREKPWVAVSVSMAISTVGMSVGDRARADALARASRQSFFEQVERWARETYDHTDAWQEASFSLGYGASLTAEELTSLRVELEALLDRYQALGKGRPGVAPIVFQAWGFPIPGSPVPRTDGPGSEAS